MVCFADLVLTRLLVTLSMFMLPSYLEVLDNHSNVTSINYRKVNLCLGLKATNIAILSYFIRYDTAAIGGLHTFCSISPKVKQRITNKAKKNKLFSNENYGENHVEYNLPVAFVRSPDSC